MPADGILQNKSTAGSDVLRIVPPLVITKEHIDKMAAILDECME